MEVKTYEQLGEKVYYEKLDNGLQVYLMPKAGFNKTYATFTTKYGSIDNHFVPLHRAEPTLVPDGIAHFLEHKLFEKEDYDVFNKFSEAGASSNAFTSFSRTCYLFSTTSDVETNLNTLLDFVQFPYFTEETVEKEKGIIEEEIKMYEDNADFKAYFGVLNNLYVNHPIKIDIAGTVESIYKITANDLHVCYNTFYHPSNMILFVVGDIDPKALIEVIKVNQDLKDYKEAPEIKRLFPEEPCEVAIPEKTVHMQVSTPKVMVGVKGEVDKNKSSQKLAKELWALDILLEMLVGTSTSYYEQITRDGLTNDSFAFDATHEKDYSYCFIGGDSNHPEELANSVKARLRSASSLDLDKEAFLRTKRKKIGQLLSAFNSVEFIANSFTEHAFAGLSLFELSGLLEELELKDVKAFADDYFLEERMTVFTILPKDDE